jgi:hypothetical protein
MAFLDRFREQPEPKPDLAPRSAAGRGHTDGFLEVEETNPALIMQAGLAEFDLMYRTDGDVKQALALVANPMTAGTWDVEPHGGAEADDAALEDAEFVKWALFEIMEPNFHGHMQEMLPVLLRAGFAPFEELYTTAKWDKDGKEYLVLRKLDLRLPRTIWRWFQDDFGDLHSIVQQLPVPKSALVVKKRQSRGLDQVRNATNGEALMPNEVELLARDIVYYRIGAEGDNWEGTSILRPAYKHWLMKDATERVDVIAQEREAVGIPICYPPMSATPGQLDEMENVLQSMRTNEQGYIIAPGPKAGTGAQEGTGWLIEVIGYERSGSGRDPQPTLAYHTQKIYASVIAEFMRLGHGSTGARATAEIQADPYLQSIEALSRGIESQLQRLIDKLIAFNRPKAKASPRIRLSKVDSTSLTQLADYVMKLSQAGALLPDKRLEQYLRERADLPQMDPNAVKARGKSDKADTDLRKEVLTGGGQFGDAMAGNKPGGGSGAATPKSSGKTKPKKLSTDQVGRRLRHRAYRPEEEIVNLDSIEDFLDDLPDHFATEYQGNVTSGDEPDFLPTLGGIYSQGREDMRHECNKLGKIALARPHDKGEEALKEMDAHARKTLKDRMDLAGDAARLNHGDDADAEIQLARETEGMRALRAIALGHGSSAYQLGRHDALAEIQIRHPEIGFMYTSMLDNRVCPACDDADDGVPRSADDPVRLDNRPPNRHCFSNLSGYNYCRCLELPVVV